MRSCSMPVGAVTAPVVTIEGLGQPAALHAVQKAWIEHQVAQCGYCQSGQLMSAAALLAKNNNPSDADIDNAMSRLETFPDLLTSLSYALIALIATGMIEPKGLTK